MKKLIGILAVVVAMFMVSLISIGSARAYKQITANEAFDKWVEGAKIIDVRTAAEYFWVGSCAKVINITLKDGTEIVPDHGKALEYMGYEVYWVGGTLEVKSVKDIANITTEAIAYNIPWKMWANGLTKTSDEKYKAGGIVVKYLFGLIVQEKFPDKTTPIITMCRSGDRSEAAAAYLEDLGYEEVYEIDNKVAVEAAEAAGKPVGKRGGHGGFQGGSYSNIYNGYRGYPNRLPLVGFGIPDDTDPSTREVETVTADLGSDDKDDSVSWLDTGLPISQTFPSNLVWQQLIQ